MTIGFIGTPCICTGRPHHGITREVSRLVAVAAFVAWGRFGPEPFTG